MTNLKVENRIEFGNQEDFHEINISEGNEENNHGPINVLTNQALQEARTMFEDPDTRSWKNRVCRCQNILNKIYQCSQISVNGREDSATMHLVSIFQREYMQGKDYISGRIDASTLRAILNFDLNNVRIGSSCEVGGRRNVNVHYDDVSHDAVLDLTHMAYSKILDNVRYYLESDPGLAVQLYVDYIAPINSQENEVIKEYNRLKALVNGGDLEAEGELNLLRSQYSGLIQKYENKDRLYNLARSEYTLDMYWDSLNKEILVDSMKQLISAMPEMLRLEPNSYVSSWSDEKIINAIYGSNYEDEADRYVKNMFFEAFSQIVMSRLIGAYNHRIAQIMMQR